MVPVQQQPSWRQHPLSKMTIDHLDDNSLSTILEYFSMAELIQLRLVCARFKGLIQRLCRSKRTLKLFGDIHDVYDYCSLLSGYNLELEQRFRLPTTPIHDVIIGNLKYSLWMRQKKPVLPLPSGASAPNCNFLAELFPNICNLIVLYSKADKVDLPYLLDQWKGTLTSFSLFDIPNCYFGPPVLPGKILTVLQQAQRLRHLDLFDSLEAPETDLKQAHNYSSTAKPIFELPHSLLVRLESFSLCRYSFDVLPVLGKLGPKLRRLMLHKTYLNLDEFSNWIITNPVICSRLTHLIIGQLNYSLREKASGIDMGTLKCISTFCPSLQALSIVANSLGTSITPCLAKLHQLSELGLYYQDPHQLSEHSFESLQLAASPFALKSITRLHLKNSQILFSPPMLESINLSLFPSLSSLAIGEKCTHAALGRMRKNFRKHLLQLGLKPEDMATTLYRVSLRFDVCDFFGIFREQFKQNL